MSKIIGNTTATPIIPYDSGAVRFDETQNLTNDQKKQAKTNIGANNLVSYNYNDAFAIEITDGTDYDTLTTSGNYFVNSSSHASTMTNCPTTNAHRLMVFSIASANMIMQLIIVGSGIGNIFKRDRGIESPWTDWERLDNGEIVDELHRVTENIECATVTNTEHPSTRGVTWSKVDEHTLGIYGTATAARRILFLNGNDAVKLSDDAFLKTLDPGTYFVSVKLNNNAYHLFGSYETFETSNFRIEDGQIVTFESDVMIAYLTTVDYPYGTSENPTNLVVHFIKLGAVDFTSRERLDNVEAFINGLEGEYSTVVRTEQQELTDAQKQTVQENIGTIDKSIIADTYDPDATYAVGDFVIYSGQLYVCNTAITTAETWTASHWTATDVCENLTQLSGYGSVRFDEAQNLEPNQKKVAQNNIDTIDKGVVADTYDATKTYVRGDFVIYDGKLYVCKTDITTAEEWTLAHWNEKNILTQIQYAVSHKHNDPVGKLIAEGTDYNSLTTQGAYYVSSSGLAKTMTNCPSKYGHRLDVFSIYSNSTLVQVITNGYSLHPDMYYRICSSSTWSSWIHMANTSQIDELYQTMSNRRDYATQTAEIERKSDGCLTQLNPVQFTSAYSLMEDNNQIRETDASIQLSDYILCPKYIWASINANAFIYFYRLQNGEYVPDFEMLKFKTTNGVLNSLSPTTFHNRMIDTTGTYPCYVRFTEGVTVYGWNGVKFGDILSGDYSIPFWGTSYGEPLDHRYENFNTGVTVPGAATMLFARDAIIRYIYGYRKDAPSGEKKKQVFPASTTNHEYGATMLCELPSGFDYFRVCLSILETPLSKSSGDIAYKNITLHGDVSDYLLCLVKTNTIRPSGNGERIAKLAEKIINIQWSPVADLSTSTNDLNDHKAGVTYTGIPYGSRWSDLAHYFGWHVSRHTVMNALADKDSVLYHERSNDDEGVYYGLVCSAFTTLCAGMPYPMMNSTYIRHPDVYTWYTETPVLGAIHSNMQEGHSYIPSEIVRGEGWDAYTVLESISPTTGRTKLYSTIPTSAEDQAQSQNHMYNYGRKFRRVSVYCGPYELLEPPYDIDNYTIIEGAAIPYKGDRCVYTSGEDVKINIKDENATEFYLQAYEENEENNDKFDSVGNPITIPITVPFNNGNATQIIPHDVVSDALFWGIYTDLDDITDTIDITDPDNQVAMFEYHTLLTPTVRLVDDNLEFINAGEFWYAYLAADSTEDSINFGQFVGYEADGKYQRYVKKGVMTSARSIFYRGKFGAYVASLTQVASVPYNNIITNTYDSTKTYAIGDYVIYNGKLNICNTAITTAELWNAAHWTEAGVTERLQNMTENIECATVTANINNTYHGVTFSTVDEYTISMYGTATANRRILFLNGYNQVATTQTPLQKTLDPGTYFVSVKLNNNASRLHGSYNTFQTSDFNIDDGTIMTFEQDVMIAYLISNTKPYGTNDNPNNLVVHFIKLGAIDFTSREMISSKYDPTKTYAVGDFVIYEGKLYICNTSITTVENWTKEHWTETNIGQILTDIKNNSI